jgi:NTE family protein
MESKLGLVMTGGGARAAYQAGVVRAIYEILDKPQHLFDVITGNSAGAINSAYLAANAENWDVATRNLQHLWEKVSPKDVFDLRTKTISQVGLKWISGSVFGGLASKLGGINYLLDTEPLQKFLSKNISFDDLKSNLDKKALHGIALSTTNYNSGSSVIFYQGSFEISDWLRSDRFSHRTDLSVDHVMASSAIPFFFPPVQVNESYFGDGCIRQTTPLSPAIHLGADKIISIGIRYPHNQNRMKDMAFSPFGNPSIGQIVGVLLNSIFLDSLEADVERLGAMNNLVASGQNSHLKEIPILMIRPSRDLGKMTTRLNKELPGSLRYLLKGIGVSESEGLDLLSYLAFDESYTNPLMELGYEDARALRQDIHRFIDL